MTNKLQQLALGICVLSMLSGCAMTRPADPHNNNTIAQYNEQPVGNDAEATAKKKRRQNTLLAIGGALLLGAIVVHEAEDGTRDALRDAGRP